MDVLPGITGLAQINLPADSDVDSIRRKIVLDREYIETASFWLDVRVLMCTVLRLVGLSGQLAIRATGLRREVELPPSVSREPSPSIDDLMKRGSSETAYGAADAEEPHPLAEPPLRRLRLPHGQVGPLPPDDEIGIPSVGPAEARPCLEQRWHRDT